MHIEKKNVKLFRMCLLVLSAMVLAGCATSHKTKTYPKKRHRCNCPHFSQYMPLTDCSSETCIYGE